MKPMNKKQQTSIVLGVFLIVVAIFLVTSKLNSGENIRSIVQENAPATEQEQSQVEDGSGEQSNANENTETSAPVSTNTVATTSSGTTNTATVATSSAPTAGTTQTGGTTQPPIPTGGSTNSTSPTSSNIPPPSAPVATTPTQVHTPTLPPNTSASSRIRFETPADITIYEGQLARFITRVENLEDPQDVPTFEVIHTDLPNTNRLVSLGPTSRGLFSWGWFTEQGDAGVYELTLRARTSNGVILEDTLTLTIEPQANAPTKPPVITTLPASFIAYPGELFTHQIDGFDPETPNDDLQVRLHSDGGADTADLIGAVDSFAGAPATFSFTPEQSNVGDQYPVTISFSDNEGFYTFYDFLIMVQERTAASAPTSTLLLPENINPFIISTTTLQRLLPLELQ